MCSRADDPTQHALDTRQVIRPGTCKHPAISDAQVLAYHDTASGLRQPLWCTVIRHRGELRWECGPWYTVSTLDDDVVMVDEPAGAGA
jgi:hypothetical protein